MLNQFSRTELLLTEEGFKKLSSAKVAVFGLGGVGGHCAEALIRSGIKNLHLIDNDVVSITDLNRQIIALKTTIGRQKTVVAKERFLDINEEAKIVTYNIFYDDKTANDIDLTDFDYVVDAIDTVASKITLITKCKELNVPIISCMGAGNKLNPTKFEVEDIFKTSVCPLAKKIRKLLKEKGITSLKVVYSKEEANSNFKSSFKETKHSGRPVVGSNAFVPSVAGLIIASEVIKDIAFNYKKL